MEISLNKNNSLFFRRDFKKTPPPPPGLCFIPSLRLAPRKTSSHPFSPRSHRFPCFSLIMTCWHIGLRRWRWWVMSPWVCCCPMGGSCCTRPHFNSEHKGNEDYEQVASYIFSFFSKASRRGKRFNTMTLRHDYDWKWRASQERNLHRPCGVSRSIVKPHLSNRAWTILFIVDLFWDVSTLFLVPPKMQFRTKKCTIWGPWFWATYVWLSKL